MPSIASDTRQIGGVRAATALDGSEAEQIAGKGVPPL